jgi:hypothetical protein
VEPDWIDIELSKFGSDATMVPEAVVEKFRKLLDVGYVRLVASARSSTGMQLLIGQQQAA